ncbi:MAG: aminoacyl-tRNA hydrolase [Rhodoglobus sp.]
MDAQWLVVGLGNPGPGYAGHRHNVGQMAVGELADRASATFRQHKSNAVVAQGHGVGVKLVLAKPNTFMNLSGGPVAALLRFYKISPSQLIVVHDELDITFDTVRLKSGGGHGGHNGLRDIIAAVGTGDFLRVRIGIGRPPGRQSAADFVLRDFSPAEKETVPNLIQDAADAAQLLITEGLAAAQLRFHTSRP